jgi:hypothetical protein
VKICEALTGGVPDEEDRVTGIANKWPSERLFILRPVSGKESQYSTGHMLGPELTRSQREYDPTYRQTQKPP